MCGCGDLPHLDNPNFRTSLLFFGTDSRTETSLGVRCPTRRNRGTFRSATLASPNLKRAMSDVAHLSHYALVHNLHDILAISSDVRVEVRSPVRIVVNDGQRSITFKL